MTELTDKVLQDTSLLNNSTREILSAIQSEFKGTGYPNIEDYLSELIDQLAITDRRKERGAAANQYTLNSKSYSAEELRDAIEQIKYAVSHIIDQKVSIETHWQFIKSVHRPNRPGKSINTECVDYLVLNYDTLIEDSLALEKVPFSDGLDGSGSGGIQQY